MGAHMKTTVDIADVLFREAKREAQRRGITLRSLIESGLERELACVSPKRFTLRDASVDGDGAGHWHALTDDERVALMYGDRA